MFIIFKDFTVFTCIFFSEQKYSNASHSKEISSNIEPISSPQAQLQMIIKQLELQNKELHLMLSKNCNSEDIVKYLEEHRLHIATQIEKLKLLRVIIG